MSSHWVTSIVNWFYLPYYVPAGSYDRQTRDGLREVGIDGGQCHTSDTLDLSGGESVVMLQVDIGITQYNHVIYIA